MKILFIVNIPSPYRVDFFNELGKFCKLTVAFEGITATDRDNKWKYGELKTFKPVFMQGIRVKSDRFFCIEIISMLKQKWDFIVLGGYSSPTTMLTIEYLKAHKKPFFIEVDGGFIKKESKLKYFFKKHFISAASGWFSTGNATTKYLTHYGADKNRCYVYPFTSLFQQDLLQADKLRKCKKALRDELNMSEEKIVVAVGRFIYGKGFDILLEATPDIMGNCGIYIIGGIPTKEYQRIVKEKKLSNVHFIEFKSKSVLLRYYAAADIFVLPTRSDAWGLVINEAMAHSLPIVTTDRCIAGLELVIDDYNGYIVPVENKELLSKAINNLLINNRYNVFGERCRDIIGGYTLEKMARAHIEIFERLNE